MVNNVALQKGVYPRLQVRPARWGTVSGVVNADKQIEVR